MSIQLQALTKRMRQARENEVCKDQVVVEEIVAAVLDTMHGRLSSNEAKLLWEIAGLGRIIEQVKAGIAEVSVDAIRGSHIPLATGELDAIVEHTVMATNSILACCESLDDLAVSLRPEQAAVVQGATMKIYEACSFQDVTGQRITKIVKALQAIEAKISELSGSCALSKASNKSASAALLSVSVLEAGSLMSGPSLAADALNQSDIDSLLAAS